MHQEEIFQVHYEVPYKQVEALEVKQVIATDQNNYKLVLDYKFKESSKNLDKYILQRSYDSICWLFAQLKSQRKGFLVVPNVEFNIVSSIWKYIKSKVQKSWDIQKKYSLKLMERTIFRAFKLVNQITLKFMYLHTSNGASALFIFLDEGMSLYQNSIFSDQNQNLSSIKGIPSIFAGSGHRLLQYVSKPKKNLYTDQLEALKKKVKHQQQEIDELKANFQAYVRSMEEIGDNFLEYKKIFRNQRQFSEHSLKMEMEIGYLEIITSEIQDIKLQCLQLQDQKEVSAQLELYASFITFQLEDTKKAIQQIISELIAYMEQRKQELALPIGKAYVDFVKEAN